MIPLFKVFMSKDVIEPVNKVLMSGYITQGKQVEEFEKKLQEVFNYPYILTLNSATSGLTLALRILKDELKLTNKDEVLSSPLTCMATNIPIVTNGLNIKWVDVDENNCNINLDDLEKKITKNTKVIMFVHWGGYPVELDKLNKILDRTEQKFGFRPRVIEDCAHAFMAEYNNKMIGTHGNISVFSLQAIKHLTTGDGGLIFLSNKKQYEIARILRWYGIDRDKRNYKGKDFRLEHDVSDWGYKFHMNDINATIGMYNLPYMKENIKKNRENAKYFYNKLSDIKEITLLENSNNRKSAYWLLTIFVKDKLDFIQYMKEKNIMCSQVHQRNDVHSCFKEFRTSLPILDRVEQKMVSIPVGWWLSDDDKKHIVKSINDFYK